MRKRGSKPFANVGTRHLHDLADRLERMEEDLMKRVAEREQALKRAASKATAVVVRDPVLKRLA